MERPQDFYRPTWIEIDLKAITQNLDRIREHLRPGTEILVPVKANAYGHGAVEIARFLETQEISFLGVASIDEAVFLKQEGIRLPILVLSTILEHEIEAVMEFDLIQTVCTEESARQLDQKAARLKKRIPVHLKVDTGMGRIGVWHEEAFGLAQALSRFNHLSFEGLYTHLANADDADPAETALQIERFRKLAETLKKHSLLPPFVHMANSAGLLHYPASHFNLVRPGLAVYGVDPCYADPKKKTLSLKPALSFFSRIVYLKKTPKGRKISYGGTYTTSRETLIATLPVGYADGYNRLLSNRSSVLVRGKRAPLVGRICMDQMMVDVGECPGVSVGDEVVLIGRQEKEEIRVEELTTLYNTIPYEFLTQLSSRIPRFYQDPSPLVLPLTIDKENPSSV